MNSRKTLNILVLAFSLAVGGQAMAAGKGKKAAPKPNKAHASHTVAVSGADKEFADGFLSAQKEDYAKAAAKWEPLAKQGNVAAQFNMGTLYHSGAAGKFDEAKAVEWYHQAAKGGSRMAQEYLAAAYAEGWFGLKKDAKEAAYWEKLADENPVNF